jgi:DNA-binding IclR family transcriptional regulator
MSEPKKAQQGINSIVIGISILEVIVDEGNALSLNAIAQKADMPPAKVHRYLVSLIETGLVSRLKEAGVYDLGPKALKLGLRAIKRIDRVNLAKEELDRLNAQVDETVFLTIWNNGEALVVGRKVSSRRITLMVRIGESFSPIYSAVGRLFAAHLDDVKKQQLLSTYSTLPSKPKINGNEVDKIDFMNELDTIQEAHFSKGTGDFQSNVVSMSVPVFGSDGKIEFALTIINFENDVDGENKKTGERLKQELIEAKDRLTIKLGSWEAI